MMPAAQTQAGANAGPRIPEPKGGGRKEEACWSLYGLPASILDGGLVCA